jgi:hypothetical protein
MMNMEEKTQDTKTLQIAKDHIVPLIAQLGLVENDLSGLFDIPPASESSANAADAWWQAQKEEDRHTYRGALAAIAAPMLIADIAINARNEKLIITHAVVPSLRWNDPVYLLAQAAGTTQFHLEYLRQADLFANTLLLYLQGAAPVYEMEMKFEVPARDFAVLLATADLRQRLQFRALLDHAAPPSSVKEDDVMVSVTEGYVYPDPRWLLSFSLPVLHISPAGITRESVRQSLDNLAKTGLIQKDADRLSLTEPGERFCESVAGRTSCIRIDIHGADEKGRRGRQSVLFVRGEHFLWYAGTSGRKADTMIVTTIGLDQAEALLKELFTPLAAPTPAKPVRPAPAIIKAPVREPVREPAPAVASPPPPPQYQAPAPAAPASGGLVCRACGNPLAPADRFCSRCLVKVPDVAAPGTVTATAPAAAAAPPAPAYEPPPPVSPPQSAAPSAGGLVCRACGNPLAPADRFCSRCLVKVPDGVATAPVQPTPPPPPPPPQYSAPAAPGSGGLVCRACGKPVKQGLKFCSNCGARIQ